MVADYKFRASKAEQDVLTLQATVTRLESQVIRYKSAMEQAEKVEDELKCDRRKLQREVIKFPFNYLFTKIVHLNMKGWFFFTIIVHILLHLLSCYEYEINSNISGI